MTSTVWHSDLLPRRFPGVYTALNAILEKHGVAYRTIPGTRDIWCRDYMPVQAADGSLVQFVYWPRYLRGVAHADRITTPACYTNLPFASRVSESVLILDGGAVEICGGIGIVTERVFADNYWYPREELTAKLMTMLKLTELIVIPVEPDDETGHVDGVVRFVDEQRVVMNDYSRLQEGDSGDSTAYGRKVERILRQSNLQVDKLPYAPTNNLGSDDIPAAIGCYINFLRVDNLVVLPQFGLDEDSYATQECKKIFGMNFVIETIDCKELAWEGGVLNCISWTGSQTHDKRRYVVLP